MPRKVVITGMGLLAPSGLGVEPAFAQLMQGRSAVKRMPLPTTLPPSPQAGPQSMLVAPVELDLRALLPAPAMTSLDRCTQLALIAVGEAVRDAAWQPDEAQRLAAGVYWGTGMGGAGTIEIAYEDIYRKGAARPRPMTVPYGMVNATSGQIGIAHGITGPVITFSNACASSANAIGEAMLAIRNGRIDSAIAGGSESFLVYAVVKAWESLRVLALEDATDAAASCRPFSLDRTGLVLGEGAGALILEAEDTALARGARILATLSGYGASNDATHITKPSVTGQTRAMRAALQDAGLHGEDVGYINAHGTGTPVGDEVETNAIKAVFGEHAAKLAVSATKSMHGHLIGAAGAVELVVSVQALVTGSLPPTANLRTPDPACDLDYVANAGRTGVRLDAVMSNSFAFGGADASLVVTRRG